MRDFEVLVLEGTNPTGVAMTRDVLDAARALSRRVGAAAPTVSFHSPDGGDVALQGGLRIGTRRLPRTANGARVLLVPGLWVHDEAALQARLARDDARRAARYIARRAATGATVAASCSSAFLLQAAGLLAGRRATTTWWLAPALARLEPTAIVDARRILCVDGPVITGGAAFAQADILLHLVRRLCGVAIADAVSRALLLQERTESAQAIVPSPLASGSALVAQLAQRVESSLPAVPSVAELAQGLCVSERTLGRHVRAATGLDTRTLVQSVRLQRARALLQTSRLGIDEIAAAVGYGDATALRRLMRKLTGTTPGHVRAAAAVASGAGPARRASRHHPLGG